jgi:DNA-directed RNA polymerase sigma subunit (sigma70/sigma32)
VAALLARLGARPREALGLRFGLGGGPPLSRDEVARRFGVTPQRVSRVLLAALEELRLYVEARAAR